MSVGLIVERILSNRVRIKDGGEGPPEEADAFRNPGSRPRVVIPRTSGIPLELEHVSFEQDVRLISARLVQTRWRVTLIGTWDRVAATNRTLVPKLRTTTTRQVLRNVVPA